MKSTAELEKRIDCLEKENQYLKKLLADAGISYSEKETDTDVNEYDPNQGARIIPREITETDAKVFFSMFWGRTDVYSKRTIKKSTGEVNYYTQCYNFWKNGCPRITGSKIKCQDCQRQAYRESKKEQIIDHLRGNSEDATDVIGVFPLLPDDTCRFIVFDFDNHEKDAEKNDFANTDDLWKEEVDSLRRICDINGIDALVERSRSGRGAHLWIFFQKPIEAELARKFGNALLNKGAESVNLKSFRFYDRMLPMQNHLQESQIPAVDKLLQNDNGILNAATAFGKTVVCCNVIAKRQVSTLILLQSSALMEQWQEALTKFLHIDEELPEYETPTGRKKRRKSVVGKLQGAHDSTTGIIDIAMVGSVCKNGEYHRRLKEYGLILVDECHHAASDTIVDILQEAKAKYVYGVTATPFRGDGLEK